MGRAPSLHVKYVELIRNFGRNHLGYLDVDGRLVLKCL
jgi:hypothetical protein